jgi:REP element-mobilizing transposase RayT
LARPSLSGDQHPVHVTLRVLNRVRDLRSGRCFSALLRAFAAGRERFGFRLNHFTVQGNHMHFVVEAEDERALARGMQGLAIRMAKALNRVMKTRGTVFADHYHSRILKTPTEVFHVLRYQLHNHEHHFKVRLARPDRCSSWGVREPPTVKPRTWLLKGGWRRAIE